MRHHKSHGLCRSNKITVGLFKMQLIYLNTKLWWQLWLTLTVISATRFQFWFSLISSSTFFQFIYFPNLKFECWTVAAECGILILYPESETQLGECELLPGWDQLKLCYTTFQTVGLTACMVAFPQWTNNGVYLLNWCETLWTGRQSDAFSTSA